MILMSYIHLQKNVGQSFTNIFINSKSCCREAGGNPRWGTPWTGRQFIAGLTQRQTSIHTHIYIHWQFNLPNPHVLGGNVGRNQDTWIKNAQARGEHANSTKKGTLGQSKN